MSISDGPKITKDSSLIVNLDAANKKSYLGTGTNWTNLVNKKNGILTNSPSFNSSNQGSLVFTRASNTYIDYGAVSGSFTSFTVIVWFYPTNIANYENVLDCNYAYNGTTGNIGPRLEMTAGGNLAWVYSNSTTNNMFYYAQDIITSGMTANTWYCTAITYDGTGNSSITYLNGLNTGKSRTTTGSPTGFIGVMNNLRIGQGFSLNSQTAERGFDGRVSSVQIYNRVLTSSEVYNNFVANRGRFGV
jgi:Concanavalin A-like lectin/glucanases superfamily